MMTFVQPIALLLLLLLVPLWALGLAARRVAPQAKQGPLAFWLSLLLPTVALVALTGALAGTQVILPEGRRTVVFLLDRSDSIAPGERARAEAYLRDAFAALPVDDQAGLVVFGQRAAVARLPGLERTLDAITVTPEGGRTDIGGAVQLALALLPAEGRRRLVLLSDGNENMGDVQQAAQLAAAQDVPLDVVPLASGVGGFDVQITGLQLPPSAREGQRLRLRVQTNAPTTTPARLLVLGNGIPIADLPVQVAAGRGAIEAELPAPPVGFNRYTVQLDVANDMRPQNNRVETFSAVSGPPRVLLVANGPAAVAALRPALEAASIVVAVVAPQELPTSLGELSSYDAVVLVNVEFGALPTDADTLLPAYVRDLGRGLAMVGGPRSFGAGGYRGSAIEDALPVTMDPRPDKQSPPVAMVVLMDVSGSMAKREGDSTKLQLAALGATRMAEQLRDEDTLTVIPFDRTAMGTIGPFPGSERATLPERLKGLSPGSGGINLFDGLQTAKRYLDAAEGRVRHLLVLTDGDDTAQKEGSEGVVRQLNREGVTVTMLALGNGRDVQFVQGLARIGGGRFFLSRDAASLPTIMSDEARLVLRPYLIEGPFTPAATLAAATSAMLPGVGALPPLAGYVSSQAKERATVLFTAEGEDPLLATWQYGLGRSLAWTSDMTGQWANNLVRSPQFPLLAAQLVSWLLPPPQAERLALEARPQGDALLLTVTTADEAGRTISGLGIAGQLLAADGRGQSVALRETSPGTYQTLVQGLDAGSYAIELIGTDSASNPFATAIGGAVLANTSEYRDVETNQQLLNSLATLTNGQIDPAPAAIYSAPARARGRPADLTRPLLTAALILLPLTVLARRLRFRRGQLPQGIASANQLSLPDRAWLLLFGIAPFYEGIQRRTQRRSEQQAWASWVHQQAEQVRRATEEKASE